MSHDHPLWIPSAERIAQSHLRRFHQQLQKKHPQIGDAYQDLHHWSVTQPQEFWPAVADFVDLIWDQGPGPDIDTPNDFMAARFFPNAKLNYAENLLRYRTKDPAIIYWTETGMRRVLTFEDLYAAVSQMQGFFQDQGLRPGDRVAGMVSNTPETLICALAVASLGGVWASCSPDFGVEGAVDRFGQITPRFFIGCDQYSYRGKTFPCLEKVQDIVNLIPSIEKTVILPFAMDHPLPVSAKNMVAYGSIQNQFAPSDLEFPRFDFNHPLFIMFSSGTTGKPKCIVHGAGGTLLQHMKEHQLHCDIRPLDRVFYYSTCGWMMWNWHISALASGATLLVFEGAPMHPTPDILMDFASTEKMTHFGTSSKYIDALRKPQIAPQPHHDLSALRMVMSTGGPLVAESFEYFYNAIHPDICLASIAGGTDIISCFVLGNSTAPVYRGEIQACGLGMDVDVFDEHGLSMDSGKGELVCRSPFPSKPLGFWDDKNNDRFRSAYFGRFDNIWNHGDFMEKTVNGGLIIHGRSDTVLNPGGVRIGTAEIYRQVEGLSWVTESLAIGQSWDDDVRVILFVVLDQGLTLTEDHVAEIKRVIRQNTTPRHVPSKIIQVTDLPRTKSGKLAEIAVRDIIHKRPIHNAHALANPQCLKEFESLPHLETA